MNDVGLHVRSALVASCAAGAALTALALTEGALAARSPFAAVALLAPFAILLAGEIPTSALMASLLTLRIIFDDHSNAGSQAGTTISPTVVIALVFLILAAFELYRNRRGTSVAALSLAAFSGAALIAALEMGASSLVLREPLREASIVAVGIIAVNASGFNLSVATRVIQIAGAPAAVLALYQGLTGTGMDIAGTMRANGTFSHPNSAALYFAVAATASLWRYFDRGRRTADVCFGLLFVAGTIVTFSLGGMATLVGMFVCYGTLRRGSVAIKLVAWLATGLIVIVFMATPLGAERIAQESAPLGTTYSSQQSSNSINWRIYNWKTLIPVWRESPIIGHGLGSTIIGDTPTGFAPHNEYLRYLVETGIAGCAVIAFAVWRLLVGIRRIRLRPAVASYGTLGTALVFGFLLNALVANTLVYTPGAYACALLLGAILRSSVAAKREVGAETSRSNHPRAILTDVHT